MTAETPSAPPAPAAPAEAAPPALAQAPAAALAWHDEGDVLGVRVRLHFFEPEAIDPGADVVSRQLPLLQGCGVVLMGREGERQTWRAGCLQAQPDAVFSHGNGLLCLSSRPADARPVDRERWRGQWRVDVMLQSIACAMAVAGQSGRPTAALWRGANVLCQFDPGVAVLECLATHVVAARTYWREPDWVSPAQLAAFCEPRLRALPGLGSAGVPATASGF